MRFFSLILSIYFIILAIFNFTFAEVDNDRVTIIITLYSHQRIDFALKVISAYQEPAFRTVIKDIIVVWNNVFFTVPPAVTSQKDLIVIPGQINSLNNRWILPIPYIKTGAIVMHDDDMFAKLEVFQCMIAKWKKNPDRLISHFVRMIEDTDTSQPTYVYDQLEKHDATYSLAIRMILISTKFLKLYSATMTGEMLNYVTYHVGMCDDVAINMVSSQKTKLAPLRVMLPPNSLYHYDRCGNAHGIGDVANRTNIRTECTQHLLSFFPDPHNVLVDTNDLAYCPGAEKEDTKKTFNNINIPCTEVPEEVVDKKQPPLPSMSLERVESSLSKYKYRLGLIAMEFWSLEVDGRKGG